MQGIKWDAPLDLDFGLALWRLRTMAIRVESLCKFENSATQPRCSSAVCQQAPGSGHTPTFSPPSQSS